MKPFYEILIELPLYVLKLDEMKLKMLQEKP
jgi:hypothetical protein